MSIQTRGPFSWGGGPIGHTSAKAGVAAIAAVVPSMARRVTRSICVWLLLRILAPLHLLVQQWGIVERGGQDQGTLSLPASSPLLVPNLDDVTGRGLAVLPHGRRIVRRLHRTFDFVAIKLDAALDAAALR